MEREYFQSFQYFEPDVQTFAFKQADNFLHDRGPDFRAEVGSGRLGVEVTRIFKPSVAKGIESTEEKIFDETCRRAFDRKLPPADVHLFFNVHTPLDARVRSRIADAVVQVVERHMPAVGDSAELEMKPGQPREVDLILINRVHCHPPGRWDFGSARIVQRHATKIVQSAIDEKANKLDAYLKCCSECWLLVVADSFRDSGSFDFDDLGGKSFSSPFSRTYLLDFGRGGLHRLPVG